MSEADYVDKKDFEDKAWEDHDSHTSGGDLEQNHDELCGADGTEEELPPVTEPDGETDSNSNEDYKKDERYISLINRVNTVNLESHKKDFVVEIFPILYKQEKISGILLEIMFAQMCIEFSNGQDDLVELANNYFGIKGTGPEGSVNIHTGEHFDGKDVVIKDNFRKYSSMEQSIEDYVKLLDNRYRKYAVDNTLKSWAQALVDGGYATAPGYNESVLDVARYWRIYEYK